MPACRIRRYMRHGMLPQLTVFEAVTRLGSYTRAGEELFVAQPTVSIQMKKLAETLGLPLVQQIGKKLVLTDAGRELAEACKDIFERLELVETRLAGLRDVDHGRLRVAVGDAGKQFVARMLGEFCKRHPNVEAALHVDNWGGMRERIQQHADDLYVVSPLPQGPELTAFALTPNPIELIAPAGHRLARERDIDIGRLADESFILREPGAATRRLAQDVFARHGLNPRVRMELASDEAVEEAVRSGCGIALRPRPGSAAASGNDRRLCVLDVKGFPVVLQWFIAYPRGRQLPRVASAFLDHVRAHAGADACLVDEAPVSLEEAMIVR